MKKIAVITCYKLSDYVQAVTIRRAIQAQKDTQTYIIKNQHRGLLRYPEVLGKVLWLRLRQHPDTYLITFRGYEILPFVSIITWPRKLIFDELVNPVEWLQESRQEQWAKLIPQKLLTRFYRILLKRTSLVISDTPEHARYSARLLQMSPNKFVALPVGTDEKYFHPRPAKLSKEFTIFYYGNILPLHGLDHVLAAAERLSDKPIRFVLAGGTKQIAAVVQDSIKRGANIEYHNWIPFAKIPDYVAASNLVLGGPFGKTTQAKYVITGKTYQFIASGKATLIGANKPSSLFVNKQNCLTVPLGDTSALVKQILWATEHPTELLAIGRAGRQLFEANYSSIQLAKQMTDILARS